MIVALLLLHLNYMYFGYEMEHKIPVISVCVNQYGEERYADIYINVNVKTLYLARSTLSNLRRI